MTKLYDKDGVLIEQSTNTYTLKYERKVGLPNYSSEDCSLIAQVVVEPGTEPGEIETQLEAEAAFVKTFVLRQLGVESGLVGGVVQTTPSNGKAASSSSPAASSAGGGGGATADKSSAWQYLLDNPEAFFDNRSTKVGKQPDFKGKNTAGEFKGVGLWLDSKATPQWAKEKLAV